ncbi:MAG: hypothetical protein F6K36_17540 [Symploca sp. SIO3C6]|uniref:Uncharacterized protein n=1 Tax=Symploca sp. SIO1C4 TaxID=2607765 RepID=A0A6B3ND67_9CYAN|nr:hypothetical protein [Symploca sp. SIO3C6]NER29543.1 hypothetical protein [Symploca sp. SIO1C4]NET07232.1 hypothetical protein [Symploca sp. SIO2B6]
MSKRKWLGWIMGSSLIGSGLIAFPASAQPNLSDLTGGNVWNNTSPIFDGSGEISPEIISNARRLRQELAAASESCNLAAIPAGPRRFSRGVRLQKQICPSPECLQFSKLITETREFIDGAKAEVEQVRVNRNSPTW